MIIRDNNFSYFSSKPYVVAPYLNRLIETVQMRSHKVCFYAEITEIIPNTPSYLELCNRAQLLKERTCSSRSKFFLLE